MDVASMIPTPDPIPAPWWLFELLDNLLFFIHILFMNVVLGGVLLAFMGRLGGKETHPGGNCIFSSITGKIPTSTALAINLGIPPLLFIQVIYGHYFYSSSIFMAWAWILIIPLLIIAYYMTYVHQHSVNSRGMGTLALGLAAVIFLYIAFMFTNNMTLMVQPERWTGYFENRSGWMLNLGDPTLLPRFLHMVTGAVAVAGLFAALVWRIRAKKGVEGAAENKQKALKLFGIVTGLQILLGFWFLLALPRDIMLLFMSGNMVMTVLLLAGILLAIGAMVLALLDKFMPTLFHVVALLLVMVTMRAFVRYAYLNKTFTIDSLTLEPQYGVMVLFFVILLVGLGTVAYMVNAAVQAQKAEEARS